VVRRLPDEVNRAQRVVRLDDRIEVLLCHADFRAPVAVEISDRGRPAEARAGEGEGGEHVRAVGRLEDPDLAVPDEDGLGDAVFIEVADGGEAVRDLRAIPEGRAVCFVGGAAGEELQVVIGGEVEVCEGAQRLVNGAAAEAAGARPEAREGAARGGVDGAAIGDLGGAVVVHIGD
jgi:hypothetical protein